MDSELQSRFRSGLEVNFKSLYKKAGTLSKESFFYHSEMAPVIQQVIIFIAPVIQVVALSMSERLKLELLKYHAFYLTVLMKPRLALSPLCLNKKYF